MTKRSTESAISRSSFWLFFGERRGEFCGAKEEAALELIAHLSDIVSGTQKPGMISLDGSKATYRVSPMHLSP